MLGIEAIFNDTKRSESRYGKKINNMMGGGRLSYYQMLENVHVIIRNRDQINFWEQEIYNDDTDFAEACLDVRLLLKEGLCKIVESDDEKNGE